MGRFREQLPWLYVSLLAATCFLILPTITSCQWLNPEPNPPVRTIDSTGGSVEVVDPESPIQGARVEVPEGALDKPVVVSIREDSNGITPPPDSVLVSPCIHVECSEPVTFSKACLVAIPVDRSALDSPDLLVVLHIADDGRQEETRPASVDAVAGTVSVYVQSFSLLAIIKKALLFDYVEPWNPRLPLGQKGGHNWCIDVRRGTEEADWWNEFTPLEVRYQVHYFVNYNFLDNENRNIAVDAWTYEDDLLRDDYLPTSPGGTPAKRTKSVSAAGLGTHRSGVHYFFGPNGFRTFDHGEDRDGNGTADWREFSDESIGWFSWYWPPRTFLFFPELKGSTLAFEASISVDDGDAGSDHEWNHGLELWDNKEVKFAPPSFVVTSPREGQTLRVGEKLVVEWTAERYPYRVVLVLHRQIPPTQETNKILTGTGGQYGPVAASLGRFEYTIQPGDVSSSCEVMLANYEGSVVEAWDQGGGWFLNVNSTYEAVSGRFAIAGAQVPSSPRNVTASQGTYADRVRVAWGSVAGTTEYAISRATSQGGPYGTPQKATGGNTSTWDDIVGQSTGSVQHYWYRVEACNQGGCSVGAVPVEGWAQAAATPPSPPSGISATQGTYSNEVRIIWSRATGATGYKIYRAGPPRRTTRLIPWPY
jgi:hypothetical protein